MDPEEKDSLLGPTSDHSTSHYGTSTGSTTEGQQQQQQRQEEEEEAHGFRVYKRRFYILGIYSLMCFVLGANVSTYGTIALASEEAFGWDNADIALLSAWQPIAFILFIPVFVWLIDLKGLRIACVLSAFLMALGSGLRCISQTPPLSDWLNHLGQFLIGICSAIVFGAPSSVSAVWFSAKQRTTATATASISSCFGGAIGFVVGPMLAPVRHPQNTTNITTETPLTSEPSTTASLVDNYRNNSYKPLPDEYSEDVPPYIQAMREDIALYLYIEFAFSALVFLIMLVYFPARPPSPPSASASSQRVDFRNGMKEIRGNSSFWILAFVYSVTNGIYMSLVGVLEVDLAILDIPNNQQVAGNLVFFAMLALVIVGFLIARIADRWTRHLKAIIIIMCVAASAFFLWFALIVERIIPAGIPELYVSFILASVAMNAAVPIFYELACEVTFPVSEGLANGLLNLINNLFSVAFLVVLMIPNIGTSWMNWSMLGAVAVCIPILIPFRQRYGRLEVDVLEVNPSPAGQAIS